LLLVVVVSWRGEREKWEAEFLILQLLVACKVVFGL
jgi:hypothetical protein